MPSPPEAIVSPTAAAFPMASVAHQSPPDEKKPIIHSGFFLPAHYKHCKATSGYHPVRSLVGTLSIVCLLLGAVNAQSNSLTKQHSNSGSYGITATTQAQDQQHHVDLARELFISIPPLNAAEALNRFAKQTGIQMLYSYEQVFTRKARPVVGQYAVMDALTLLLEGSGL